MKILIATGVYPPESGGPATYSALLEQELPKRGIGASVLAFRDVRHLPPLVRHAAYFFKCLSRSRGCSIVYAQDTVSVGLPAALAALLMRKTFMLRVPGDYAWEQSQQRFGVSDLLDEFQHKRYGWKTELLRRIQRFVVRRARIVVTPSEYMKRIVAGWGVPPERIHRIYSSIEIPIAYALPHERPQGFLVVSSGRRVPWKNFDGIERAVAREQNWQFHLVENLPRVQAMGWIKTADVFVLNSTYEGLSHLLVEAMSLGTPVVATNVGGNPELIESGVEGILIPVNDDDALYAALKEVADHPEAARERAARARDKANQFDIQVALNSLTQLLKSL